MPETKTWLTKDEARRILAQTYDEMTGFDLRAKGEQFADVAMERLVAGRAINVVIDEVDPSTP